MSTVFNKTLYLLDILNLSSAAYINVQELISESQILNFGSF
jgi:hypothetical protein